jgi:hypothetical protein
MSFQYKNENLHPAIEHDRRMRAKAERHDDRGTQIGLGAGASFGMDAPRGTCRRNGVSADAHRLVMAPARGAGCSGPSRAAEACCAA